MEKSRKAMEEADLVILLLDGSKSLEAQDEELWHLVHTSDCLSCGNYSKSMRGLVKGIISTFNL